MLNSATDIRIPFSKSICISVAEFPCFSGYENKNPAYNVSRILIIYLSSVKFGMIFGRSVSLATFQDVLYIHSVSL